MTADGLTGIIGQIIKHTSSSDVTIVRDKGGVFRRGWFGPKKLRQGTRLELNMKSVKVCCPRCHVTDFTEIRKENGKRTLFVMVALAIILIILKGPHHAASAVSTAAQLKAFRRRSHFCRSCNIKLGKNRTFLQRLGF
ncbi:hypothetical protein DL89DRAFT_263737 [Linderina pennispora]|uniref:LITAF domain-containing protein n=1 Tax=Linderina pennispora TaxID=61395 RepID=A0A1Y1WJJ7_9FUNG|nr:uncharacterized protein DL89DRAFT_263737 [Linderina pennispora]ORX73707.1 hypothetical protein DL89DRAFT_263737 [Linderina pennispora]